MKETTRTYRVIKKLIRLCFRKTEVIGAENLPDEPAIIVGNHCQLYGPILCELDFPIHRYTWCAGQMMHRKEVPDYAYRDFWSQKPRFSRPFYRILSYLITPLSVCVFNNANTIPVYRDSRIIGTFKKTVQQLANGTSVVIFPEQDKPHNHIIYDFQENFIDIARLYYKKTGKALPFVPLYIAPRLHRMILGTPIRFRPDAPMEEERQRIRACLMEEITALACDQPRHRVVPYRNIPKRLYPFSK